MVKALATPLKMIVDEIDIVGLKAIVKCSEYAMQKNGRAYNNKCVSSQMKQIYLEGKES